MQPSQNGFITAAEAIELIKAHTNDKPVVDLNFLVVNRDYIDKGHNFTIKLVEKKDGKVVEAGVLYAQIMNDAEKYTLREEIKQSLKRNTGLDLNLDERPTREVTSVVDPDSNPKGAPMIDNSKDPMYFPKRNTTI